MDITKTVRNQRTPLANSSTPPTIDIATGLEHLLRLDATGMHQLAAIQPDNKDPPKFITFRLDEAGKQRATAFLTRHGLNRNIYFSINEVRPDLGNKRAKKEDVLNIRMIGADLDPAKDVVLTPDVLAREFARLDDIRQNVACEPEHFYSSAVATGGGIQIAWRLRKKLPASQFQEAVENQTRGILRHLGAEESTSDITRLFRLPGTFNFPTPAKRLLGRNELMPARVIEYIDESDIDFAEFRNWVEPVSAPKHKASVDVKDVSLDMGVIEEASISGQLPAELETKFAAQRQTDEKLDRLWSGDKSAIGGADTSRSAFLFALAGRLRRTGVFSPTEFAQLAATWEYGPPQPDERQLARAWARHSAVAPEEEFAPVPEACWVQPFEVEKLPRRDFVCGRFAAKQYVSALISPPGVGKTTFLLMLAVAAATGRSDIVGFDVPKRQRVYLFNQEDELDELKRRLAAVMAAFDVKWSDLMIDGKPALALESGVDRALIFVRKDGDRVVRSADAASVEQFIRDNAIGLAIFDPFVELHPVDENNNVEIAAVGRIFRRIAVNGHCSVVLAHHTRKPPNAANRESYAGDMDAGRGAGALNGVARMVATLYTVDTATAKKFGLGETEARSYVRFDDAKANLALISGEPHFYKREGVTIGGFGGEEVGVLRPVKLSRVKSATETTAQENTSIRSAVLSLIRSAGGRLSVKAVVDDLIDTGVIELDSPDALRKRLTRMFEKPQTYETGDCIRSENVSEKGKRGRVLQLVLDIADNAA